MENIKEDLFLFKNDLKQYRDSIEGKRVRQAIKSKNWEAFEFLIGVYWDCRNNRKGNKLTY